MTTQLGHKAEGRFDFTDQDGQVYHLPVTRASFNLYRSVPTWPEGAMTLDIKIMVDPLEIPSSDGGAPYRIAPCLDTQWLRVFEKELKSKTRDALHGFQLTHLGGDWRVQSPACLYNDSYGSIEDMTLSLVYAPEGYRFQAKGHDEFRRNFKIDAAIGLFDVTVRHDDRTQNPDADAWLAAQFDTDDMQYGWHKKGPADGGWYDLNARWLS